MSIQAEDTNAQLRELVRQSGLADAVAMTIFNRGLGSASCSVTEWRGYLADPSSNVYRPLSAALLENAQAQFTRLKAPAAPSQAIDSGSAPAG